MDVVSVDVRCAYRRIAPYDLRNVVASKTSAQRVPARKALRIALQGKAIAIILAYRRHNPSCNH